MRESVLTEHGIQSSAANFCVRMGSRLRDTQRLTLRWILRGRGEEEEQTGGRGSHAETEGEKTDRHADERTD